MRRPPCFASHQVTVDIAKRGLVSQDEESLDGSLPHSEPLSESLNSQAAEAQSRSRGLVERARASLAVSADRVNQSLALRVDNTKVMADLQDALAEYVGVLRAMNVEPERMLVLVKTLLEPTLPPGTMARALRDDLIRGAIEAYYAA